jgi:hypothetical protein
LDDLLKELAEHDAVIEHNSGLDLDDQRALAYAFLCRARPTLSDPTPVLNGTGPSSGMAANTRIDVFNTSDLATPVQSLLAPGNVTWTGESVKGLPTGSYTAKVTQNDLAGRYNTATRSFSITAPTDPEAGYATSVRSDNPLAYWRLGETSGTTAADDRTAQHRPERRAHRSPPPPRRPTRQHRADPRHHRTRRYDLDHRPDPDLHRNRRQHGHRRHQPRPQHRPRPHRRTTRRLRLRRIRHPTRPHDRQPIRLPRW